MTITQKWMSTFLHVQLQLLCKHRTVYSLCKHWLRVGLLFKRWIAVVIRAPIESCYASTDGLKFCFFKWAVGWHCWCWFVWKCWWIVLFFFMQVLIDSSLVMQVLIDSSVMRMLIDNSFVMQALKSSFVYASADWLFICYASTEKFICFQRSFQLLFLLQCIFCVDTSECL